MCSFKQYNIVVRVNIARELNAQVFSPMVLILIRHTDASIKRITFAQIFKGKASGGSVFSIHIPPDFQSSRIRAFLLDQMWI